MNWIDLLRDRGVHIPAPDAVVLDDIDPTRFEAGAQIHPGATLRGRLTALGAGSEVGRGGACLLENAAVGRHSLLGGGTFQNCVVFDRCQIRGHAELRGGTVLDEGCEGAHHVGFKNTVFGPFTVAGSLINCCDVLMYSGTSRANHGELGSALAIYNYSPWGDKFGCLFGDVPRGLFLRAARVFVGGQTQIVAPVHLGEGVVVPAGLAVRKDVPPHRLYGEAPRSIDASFDPARIGAITPKVQTTLRLIAHLHTLRAWTRYVRLAWCQNDPFAAHLVEMAHEQLSRNLEERRDRLRRFLLRLDDSLRAWHHVNDARRIDEHRHWLQQRDALLDAIDTRMDAPLSPGLYRIFDDIVGHLPTDQPWTDAVSRVPTAVQDACISAMDHEIDRWTSILTLRFS